MFRHTDVVLLVCKMHVDKSGYITPNILSAHITIYYCLDHMSEKVLCVYTNNSNRFLTL
jgi:hypothetical protein